MTLAAEHGYTFTSEEAHASLESELSEFELETISDGRMSGNGVQARSKRWEGKCVVQEEFG